MFRRNPESRDFTIGLALTCLIATGLFAYVHWYAAEPTQFSSSKRLVEVNETPGSTPKALPVIATVFECNGENGRVLSDRPCGNDAKVREVVQPNLMPADSSAQSSRVDAHGDSKRVRAPSVATKADVSRADKDCASIDAEIDRINARMRSAYSSEQGEHFRQRLRELSDQRWQAKCMQ